MAARDSAADRSIRGTKKTAGGSSTEPAEEPSVNEVRLVGRVAAAGESRSLPSGDIVTVLRVVVARPVAARRTARTPTVDTVECAIWTARLRQRALTLPAGTMVDVQGSLRRRFWRTPGGPASRYEVEVRTLQRVAGVPVTTR